ncbi:MAG TPA: DUF2785 domain-containing protein [Marmoricola sp.]|nr:DUF2785 domain-containing protein [Nocardioidaceae bacterium]HMU36782.1 DUF2785 domain-containing protein [Marmoricola sp.]MCB8993050.1 DUF2785 domain-containing protein [Nocardioidaceae bacterium]MCO5323539.1 DUF2785 domain-containing protein [Nocardioidaceae bacterium]HMY08101.1 DUF2785 domain-containing protein [Marmoricola sp.]
MAITDWERVIAEGVRVPAGLSLGDLTADLTRMLGDPDPHIRDAVAFPTIATWISEGIYDDLLSALGDGMCTGLRVGLGESETDTVFRRSFSALVLAECIDRDNQANVLSDHTILSWGDQLTTWLTRENDLRGFVVAKGYAHAIAHGGDALAALSRSPKIGRMELLVLLDVIADRLLTPTKQFFVCAEEDRLAHAVVNILNRDLLELEVLEPWLARLANGAYMSGNANRNPFLVSGNVQKFLRSLHMQLSLGRNRPAVRADLLLTLSDHLRRTNAGFL